MGVAALGSVFDCARVQTIRKVSVRSVLEGDKGRTGGSKVKGVGGNIGYVLWRDIYVGEWGGIGSERGLMEGKSKAGEGRVKMGVRVWNWGVWAVACVEGVGGVK